MMQQLFYGQIDLTKLGQIVKSHPELIKKGNFKDGEHQLINVNILEKEEADKFGNTGCVTVNCKKDDQKLPTGAYFVADLKPATPKEQKPSIDDPIPPIPSPSNEFPF